MRRDWTEARAKVDGEGLCRAAGSTFGGARGGDCSGQLHAAHVIGSAHDEPHPTRRGWAVVRAADVVPLCTVHHLAYDARSLDLLPYLTPEEQARAVLVAGGIVSALLRTTSGLTTHHRKAL